MVIWITGYTFDLMKRKQRAYKTTDMDYKKAMQRSQKPDKTKVANLIENVVHFYGKGYDIVAHSPQTGITENLHK